MTTAFAAPRYEVEHLATIAPWWRRAASVLPGCCPGRAQARGGPRPLKAPVLHRPIGLITLRGRPLSLAAQEMVALLRQEVQSSGTVGR
jgi:hypothetical protein